MAIRNIALPFGRIVQICAVCGSIEKTKECEAVGEPGPSPLRIGQQVSAYWVHGMSRTAEPLQWKVNRLEYRAPRSMGLDFASAAFGVSPAVQELFRNARGNEEIHDLMVGLELEKTDPADTMREFTALMSYTRLLIWQRGDIAELEALHLIRKPRPPAPPKKWWQFWK